MKIQAYAARSAKGSLEPFEYEPGQIGPEEVDVRVTHCDICHTGVAMVDDDWGISQYPLAETLTFMARHGIKPIIETFPMAEADRALDHTRQGKARFRAGLVA